jgi:hypothetical protein
MVMVFGRLFVLLCGLTTCDLSVGVFVCKNVPQHNLKMRLKVLLFVPHWRAPHQLVINRLRAMAAFDDFLAQSLTEQICEIDEEIKKFTADLDSVLCLEHSTPPCKNPHTWTH